MRGHYTGDGYSSENVWMAGRNFQRWGFIPMHFSPVQNILVDNPKDIAVGSPWFYTRYPPGADIFQGILFKMGFESRLSHRIADMAVAFAGSLFCCLVLKRLFDDTSALLGWTVLLFSPSFTFFADSLQQFPWFIFFSWFYLWSVLRFRERIDSGYPARLGAWFAFFGILGFFASWFSFDAIPAFLSISGLFLFLRNKASTKNHIWLFAFAAPLGALAGFGTHLLQNRIVLGGWHAMVLDMTTAFRIRAGLLLTKDLLNYNVVKHLGKAILAIQWFYTWPLLLLSVWGWWRFEKGGDLFRRGLFLSIFGGAIVWQFTMHQHAMIHAFTYRHADLFVILGFTAFCHQARSWQDRGLVIVVMVNLAFHSILGAMQIEGTTAKRYLITHLLSEQERTTLACRHKPIMDHEAELPGAKSIVYSMVPPVCPESLPNLPFIRGHLAELILYCR